MIVAQFVRRRRDLFTLRPIRAYTRIAPIVGEAIERNRPVQLALGGAALGGTDTLLALAAAELAYQVAQEAAINTAPTLFNVSETTNLPLAQDTLRRAYHWRGRTPSGIASWLPNGQHSLSFAAGLTVLMGDNDVSANVIMGSMGEELALVAETAVRRNQMLIATSSRLEGQAVAYAASDLALIGEEVFTAGAYLGGGSAQIAALVTQDVLRWMLILAILIPTAVVVGDELDISSDIVVLLSLVLVFVYILVFIVRSIRGLRKR